MAEPTSAWTGGTFGARARAVLAPNPGIMTLEGTNTWVLREPGAARSVVVDPGPLIDTHLDAVAEAAGADGGGVGLILVTHHHADHTEAVEAFAARTGAPVRAWSADWCRDADPLLDGEQLDVDGLQLRVVATPGHTSDSVSFLVPAERALLTGDMVLGHGTTVVAHPDGRLDAYFASIERMRALAADGEVTSLWPAHGPVLGPSPQSAADVLDFYLAHRRQRLDQVRTALRELEVPADPEQEAPESLARRVVEIVYADVDPTLWPAAELSVRAQLEYLASA